MNQKILQVMDVNLNRVREGLRVCEDITRFIISDKNITVYLKGIRHGATRALIGSAKLSLQRLLLARNTAYDKQKFYDLKKAGRTDIEAIFMSNIERAKESFRVLEELTKIIDGAVSRKFRRLRFKTYDVEKRIIEKVRDLSCYR